MMSAPVLVLLVALALLCTNVEAAPADRSDAISAALPEPAGALERSQRNTVVTPILNTDVVITNPGIIDPGIIVPLPTQCIAVRLLGNSYCYRSGTHTAYNDFVAGYVEQYPIVDWTAGEVNICTLTVDKTGVIFFKRSGYLYAMAVVRRSSDNNYYRWTKLKRWSLVRNRITDDWEMDSTAGGWLPVKDGDFTVAYNQKYITTFTWVGTKFSSPKASVTIRKKFYDNHAGCNNNNLGISKCRSEASGGGCNCKSGWSGIFCNDCADGYYMDPVPSPLNTVTAVTCKACTVGFGSYCEECTVNGCTRCSSGYGLLDGKCVKNCGEGKVISEGVCVPCNIGKCKTCGTTTVCYECQSEYYLQDNECDACSSSCPEGKYIAVACSAQRNTQCGDCATCNDGQYQAQECSGSSPGVCGSCHESCARCSGAGDNQCTACDVGKGLSLSKGQCVTQCPDNTFDKNGLCTPCDSSCQTCSGSADQCTSCAAGKVLQKGEGQSFGKCLASCLEDFFPVNRVCETCHSCRANEYVERECSASGNTQCAACSAGCKTCSSPASCSKCLNNWDLVGGVCESNCVEGKYWNGASCQSCMSNCEVCLSSERCETCNVNYYYMTAAPITGSPECVTKTKCEEANMYVDGLTRKCEECNSLCVAEDGCTGPEVTDCKTCRYVRVELSNSITCLRECPPDYTEKDGLCEPSTGTFRGSNNPNGDNESSSSIPLIAGAAAGGAVILILIIVLVVVLARRNRDHDKQYGDANRSNSLFPLTQGSEAIAMTTNMQANGAAGAYMSVPTGGKGNGGKGKVVGEDGMYTANDYVDLYYDSLTAASLEASRSAVAIGAILGKGAFGDVFKATVQTTSGRRDVAAKTLKEDSSQADQEQFLAEAALMQKFSHPNVVELVAIITKSQPLLILTELMGNGSLDAYLKRSSSTGLPLETLVSFCRDIVAAMAYFESESFLHRDLAARNVLVSMSMTCKIADFGLSRDTGDEQYYMTQGGKIPIRWTAPEAIQFKKFSVASDVWSFGIVLAEIFTYGEKPYGNWTNAQVLQEIENGYKIPKPDSCPQDIYDDVMMKCWAYDKDARPSFATLKSYLDHYGSSGAQNEAQDYYSDPYAAAPVAESSQSATIYDAYQSVPKDC